MNEKIIRIIENRTAYGMTFTIAETLYEYGRHYVFFIDGHPGFHTTDLERIREYMRSYLK